MSDYKIKQNEFEDKIFKKTSQSLGDVITDFEKYKEIIDKKFS